MTETKPTTEPTWGYKRGGQKRLFAAGEIMPPDWSTKIPEGEHPHDAEQGRMPPKESLDPDGKPENTQGRTPGDEKRKAG